MSDDLVEHLTALLATAIDVNERLTNERNRLREALGKLECKCSANCDWERDDVCPSWIARAALKGNSHE